MAMGLKKDIAMAIKKADKSYFFENYDKQAAAVLAALKKQGYAVVPMEPDEKTLRTVADTIATGKMRPEQHIKNVHQTLAKLMEAKY